MDKKKGYTIRDKSGLTEEQKAMKKDFQKDLETNFVPRKNKGQFSMKSQKVLCLV